MDNWAPHPDMTHAYADRAAYAAYDATTLDSAQRYPRQSTQTAQQYYIQSSPDPNWAPQQYSTSPVRDSRYAQAGYPQPVSHPSLPPPHHVRSTSYTTNAAIPHHHPHDPAYPTHRPPSRLQTPGPGPAHPDPTGSAAYFPSSPTTAHAPPYPQQQHPHQQHLNTRPPTSTVMGERYPCHYCDKTFSRNFDRKRHMETHVPGSSGNNRCRYCRKDYSRADSLKRHLDNGCDHRPRGA